MKLSRSSQITFEGEHAMETRDVVTAGSSSMLRRWLSRLQSAQRRLAVPFVALLLVGQAAGVARLAEGHGGNNDPTVIHACVDKTRGDVRIVGVTGSCTVKENVLHWGIVGPPGQQGTAGTPGAPGQQGPPGPAGTLANFEQLDGLGCTREGFPGVIELSYDADGAAILKCAVNATPAALSANPIQLFLMHVGPPAYTVTISNDGQLASGALTVSLPTQSGNFQITADNCTGQVLLGGTTCTVQVIVIFAPPQGANGTLRVAGTPGGVATTSLFGQDLQ